MLPDPEDDTCWICLEGINDSSAGGAGGANNRLIQPCRCPRLVHSVCLAKWQLSQSGKSEEKFCRFCKDRLPDWQENLALPGMAAVEPVMSVHFNGQTHMVKVKPGEEGRVAFIQDVRRLLRLRDNQEFSITFECKVPGHGMFLDLKGLSSYDAAVFCAAMTAVERQRLAAQKAQKAAAAAAAAVGGSAAAAAATSTSTPTAAASGAGPSTSAPAATSAATPSAAAAAPAASSSSSAAAAAPGAGSAGQGPVDLRPSVTGSEGAASDADVNQSASRVASSSSGASRHSLRQELLSTALSADAHQAGSSSSAAVPTSASQVPLSLGSGRRSGAAATTVPSQPVAAGAAGGSGGSANGRNARWRSNTFDSACEVEPEGSAGGSSPTAGAAGGSVATGGAAAAANAALGSDRRKHAHRHQRSERFAQSMGVASASAAGSPAAAAGAPSLLSRLFLCAGLSNAGASRSVPLQQR